MNRQEVLNEFKKAILLSDYDGTCLLEDNMVLKAFKKYADYTETIEEIAKQNILNSFNGISCENCKHCEYLETKQSYICISNKCNAKWITLDFCCNRFERKD